MMYDERRENDRRGTDQAAVASTGDERRKGQRREKDRRAWIRL